MIDIGTGDGRFVSAAAAIDPNTFFIGIDANAKPLEKPSMRATRKPHKGGLPNVMFVQAAVERLPEELNGVADEIHIHFPWGGLLRAVATGDAEILASLRRVSAPGCLLEVVIGIDPELGKAEIERLGVPDLTPVLLHSYLVPKYRTAGFELLDHETLTGPEWSQLETSWARRLRGNTRRRVWYLLFTAI